MEKSLSEGKLKVTEIGKILKEELDKIVYGQEMLKKFVIIALLCREHLIIWGPTGVAKTFLIKIFSIILNLTRHFHQGSKFTREDQIHGPTVIRKTQREHYEGVKSLDEKIVFLREKGGYAKCRIGIWDEFNRDPESIRNSALQMLNEREVIVWNEEKNQFVIEKIDLWTLYALMNPEDFSAEQIPNFQIDRFRLGVIARNIYYKKYGERAQKIKKGIPAEERICIDELDDAMEAYRYQSDDRYIKPAKITEEILNEAYEYINGTNPQKRIEIPLIYLRGLRIFFELITEMLQLGENNLLITDRSLIQVSKLLRGHALYKGRTELLLEDFHVLFGFFTTRIDHDYHKKINTLIKLFAEALGSNHPDAVKARAAFSLADQYIKTGKSQEVYKYDREGKLHLEYLKQFFLSMKNLITEDTQSFEELRNRTSLKDMEQAFQDTKQEKKSEIQTITEVKKETTQAPGGSPFKSDEGRKIETDKKMEKKSEIDASIGDGETVLKPNHEGKELTYNPLATEGGPEESKIAFESNQNFDIAYGAQIFFNLSEKHLQKFKTRSEEKDDEGKAKSRIEADDLEKLAYEIYSADPVTLNHFLNHSYPFPLIDFKTRIEIMYGTARDRSNSMIELGKWSSELVLAIHQEAQKRRRKIGHIEFSDKIFKAGQDDLFGSDPDLVDSLMKNVKCQGETNYELLLETIVENVFRYKHIHGKSLKMIAFVTDGIPTKAERLINLLGQCREEAIIISPIYVFDPMSPQATAHFKGATEEELSLLYPSVLKNMAEFTNGLCWWGIRDHVTDKVALIPEKEGFDFAMRLIKIRREQMPGFTSSAKDYKAFAYPISTGGKAQEKPFNTKGLFEDKYGAR